VEADRSEMTTDASDPTKATLASDDSEEVEYVPPPPLPIATYGGNDTTTDPEVAQDVSAFTTFRYGSGFFSCQTKHGRRAVRRSLRVRSHQRSPPTERAPSRLDITGTIQILDSKQRKVRRSARHLKY